MKWLIPSGPALAISLCALAAFFVSWWVWSSHQEQMDRLSDQKLKIGRAITRLQEQRNTFESATSKLDPSKAVRILSQDDVVSTLRSVIGSGIQSNIVDIRLEAPLPQPLPKPFAVAAITVRLPIDHLSIMERAQQLDALPAPIHLDSVTVTRSPRRFGSGAPEAVSLELILRGRVLLSTVGGQR